MARSSAVRWSGPFLLEDDMSGHKKPKGGKKKPMKPKV